MYLTRLVGVCVLSALLTGTAGAQREAFMMTPSPMSSCGDFMAARRSSEGNSNIKAYWAVVWAWGYMSSFNAHSPNSTINIPAQTETVYLYFEKYCRENPLSDLVLGTSKLIQELGGKR